jgi:hypothetical protein
MSIHRSALGKTVDMNALIAKNEKTLAVGNMKVNARGDTVDSHGRIVKSVTEKVNEMYGKTVGNKSAHAQRPQPNRPQPNRPEPVKAPPIVAPKEELTEWEQDIDGNIEEELEIEKIKAKEKRK